MSQCICISLWISLMFFMEVLKRAILLLLVTHQSSSLVCLWRRGSSKSCFWVSLQQVKGSSCSCRLSAVGSKMLCYFLHFCLSSYGPSGNRADKGVDKGNLTCKSSGFIPLSQQKQNIGPCNTGIPCGCWKCASLQMIASSFPKGREASDCVHKCHKNKPQDVFLLSAVILVFTCNFKALKNSGTPLAFWGDFCNFCLSIGGSRGLPCILAPQTKPNWFPTSSSSPTVFIPPYIDQMLWLNARLLLS